MRGEADGQPEAADGLHRQVVLAHVHAVGADEDGQVGTVVDDERDAEPARDRAGLFQHRQQLFVG